MKRMTSVFVLISFILSCIMPPQGFAQTLTAVGLMPQPGVSVSLTAPFTPAQLKGMVIHPNDPFKFDFIINRGDEPFTQDQRKEAYSKLIKYFLAALAVPDTDQWVNLSPYEKDRIIPDGFGLTEMGRDLLAQDYLLKQISASLTNPDTDLGKKFWDGVYAVAYEKFGTTDIPTDTVNKVWIIPDKAVVYEKGNSVVVLEHHLKVMLESDYKAMKAIATDDRVDNDVVKISRQVMREVIIPAIEKEVNEGRNFAPLRQVYSGTILAAWYKRALKESLFGKVYIDKGKVKGFDQDPKTNQEIYGQYVQAFKKGVFNLIKEDVDRYSQELIPRKYFSGGLHMTGDAINSGELELIHKSASDPVATEQANGVIDVNADLVEVLASAFDAMSPVQKRISSLLKERENQGNSSPPNILFACTGNLNRSALMEMITRKFARELKLDLTIRSAGTLAWQSGQVQAVVINFFNQVLESQQLQLRGSRLEKLIKAISNDDEFMGILTTPGQLPVENKATDSDIISAFRNFDQQKVLGKLDKVEAERGESMANYKILLQQIGAIFSLIDGELAKAKLFEAKPEIISAARKGQIDADIIDQFSSNIITPAMVVDADVIIVADQTHVDFLNKNFPLAKGKTFLLKSLPVDADLNNLHLADPQALEITEEESFKEIKGLIDEGLMPIFRNKGFESAKTNNVIDIFNQVLESEGIQIRGTRFEKLIKAISNEDKFMDILTVSGPLPVEDKVTDTEILSALRNFDKEAVVTYLRNLSQERGEGVAISYEVELIRLTRIIDKMQTVDESQTVNVDNSAKGGIDFAQSNLNMQIKRDGVGVPLPVSQQDLDNIKIDGLVPVILSIQPAASVHLLN